MRSLKSGALSQALGGLLLMLIIVGCGNKGPQGGPRVATAGVTGIVHVDGQPAAYLRVTANPTGGGAVPIPPAALTTTDGKFELSTYEAGDGIPAGEYRLTFEWGEINLLNGQYTGDKLNGKYAKPDSSQVTVKVTEGDQGTDLGIIELTTK